MPEGLIESRIPHDRHHLSGFKKSQCRMLTSNHFHGSTNLSVLSTQQRVPIPIVISTNCIFSFLIVSDLHLLILHTYLDYDRPNVI